MVTNIFDIIFQPGPQYYFTPVIAIIIPLILWHISRYKLNRVGPTRRQSAVMVSILIVTFVLSIGVLSLLQYIESVGLFSPPPEYIQYLRTYLHTYLPIIVPIATTSFILFIATYCFSTYYCAIGRKQQVDTPSQELTEYD